jgi:hypothetical protein
MRARETRSATMPVNRPTTMSGAVRAKAARPTKNGEPVSWRASHPRVTRSTQRATLTKRPETKSRR